MKKMKTLIVTVVLTMALTSLFAQSPPHPNGGNAPGSGNTPVGGGAPLGSGLLLLISMAGIYSGKKVIYLNRK